MIAALQYFLVFGAGVAFGAFALALFVGVRDDD